MNYSLHLRNNWTTSWNRKLRHWPPTPSGKLLWNTQPHHLTPNKNNYNITMYCYIRILTGTIWQIHTNSMICLPLQRFPISSCSHKEPLLEHRKLLALDPGNEKNKWQMKQKRPKELEKEWKLKIWSKSQHENESYYSNIYSIYDLV